MAGWLSSGRTRREVSRQTTDGSPVTTGVPFPRGTLVDPGQCRLLDDMGREMSLQSRAAASWDADRTSIRWLTIDFIAEPGRSYFLEFGPTVSRRKEPSRLRVTTD